MRGRVPLRRTSVMLCSWPAFPRRSVKGLISNEDKPFPGMNQPGHEHDTPRGVRLTRPVCCAALAAVLVVGLVPGAARAQDPSRSPVCEDGRIVAIDVDGQDVFDPASTGFGALAWTYRALNFAHIRTRASFVRGELLFDEGDCFDSFLVSESARLLDRYDFLAEATITDEVDSQGDHHLSVATRDEWSTQFNIGGTYDGGLNLERAQVIEKNFLGRGIFAEFEHRERREVNTQSVGLATPRFFGRTDASIAVGRSRPGRFLEQYVRYPFVGETGQWAFRQGFDRGTDFFSYSTHGSEAFEQVLVPAFRELFEVSLARQFGEPGRSVTAGVSLIRDVVRFTDPPQVAFAGDFDTLQEWMGPLTAPLARQLQESSTTRVGLQLGGRRVRFQEYFGLDGVRDRQVVTLGTLAGVTVGRGFDLFTPGDVSGLSDAFVRGHASFGAPLGSSLVHGVVTVESRRADGAWRDLLLDGDLVTYLRTPALPSNTLFVRASVAGGWDTTLPFQLSLGGREGVRSLVEDRFPGGRMMRFVIEDRVAFPWPTRGADLGLTLISDFGRVWPGDTPYGVDSGWQAGLGAGLRIGFPSGTRNILRTDIVFPVGATDGGAIFRVTVELNRLRSGFLTPDVFRSRRLDLGPDHFYIGELR